MEATLEQKWEEKRFDSKSLAIAALCAFGAGAGGYLLYLDFNATSDAGRGKPMATLERRDAKVRKKPASSYIWRNVLEHENIYRKESIQTGEASAAVIKLVDGSLLELGENSLVVIDNLENLSLNFLKGSVVVRKGTGDQRISVGKDGKAKVEELSVRLTKPESLAELFVPGAEAKPVQFAWEIRGKSTDGIAVQISPDPNFKSTQTQTIETPNKSTVAHLAAGRYFWRIISKNGPLSQTRQFRVSAAEALQPVSPAAAEVVRVWGGENAIQFTWTLASSGAASSAGEFFGTANQLEVASDPGFKKIVARQSVVPVSGAATVTGLPSGDFFWRVRSRFGDLGLSSAVERFRVERNKNLALDLTWPGENETVSGKKELRFNWQSDAPGVEYAWELQTPAGKPVATSKGLAMSTVWKQVAPGAYRWRVSAKWKEKYVGQTPWRIFAISSGNPMVLVSPSRAQKIQFWTNPPPLSFRWKDDSASEGAGDYLIEVAADPEFKKHLASEKAKRTSFSDFTIKFNVGNYFWRVRRVDPSGITLKSSAVSTFSLETFALLRAPKVEGPKPGTVYNLRDDDKVPTVSWVPIPGAKAYEVTVFKREVRSPANAGAQEPVVIQKRVEGTSLEIDKLNEGKYRWSVRAIDAGARLGEAGPAQEFAVTFGARLAAPKSKSKEVQ